MRPIGITRSQMFPVEWSSTFGHQSPAIDYTETRRLWRKINWPNVTSQQRRAIISTNSNFKDNKIIAELDSDLCSKRVICLLVTTFNH